MEDPRKIGLSAVLHQLECNAGELGKRNDQRKGWDAFRWKLMVFVGGGLQNVAYAKSARREQRSTDPVQLV